jgi:hypothetical protein
MLTVGGCLKSEAPLAIDAGAAPPPPPAGHLVAGAVDAGGPGDARPDAVDGGVDASDAGPARKHGGAKKAAAGGGGGAGGVKVEGKLPKPAAEKVVHAGAGALRACYDAEHAKNPALKGKVTFRLSVDDRGRVTLGEVVTSTLGGGDPEMCMVRAARDFRFPSGNGESTVSFQVSFGR